jgi:hypothetical protein
MNTTDLDGISLEQALIDFEVANARVIDLTSRLTSLSRELLEARTMLAKANIRHVPASTALPTYAVSGNEATELLHLRDVVSQVRASRLVRIAAIFSSKLSKVLA